MKDATCPMSARDVVDRYFLENRARLLEVAAFLDRLDRTRDAPAASADFRCRALTRAIEVLATVGADRVRAMQMVLSDLSAEPRASAIGLKGAAGAWKEASDADH